MLSELNLMLMTLGVELSSAPMNRDEKSHAIPNFLLITRQFLQLVARALATFPDAIVIFTVGLCLTFSRSTLGFLVISTPNTVLDNTVPQHYLSHYGWTTSKT